MPLYQHRFLGHTSRGEQFLFTWWSFSALDLTTIQTSAVTWITSLWTNALAALCTPEVGMDQVTTGSVDQATGQQQQRMDTVVTLDGAAVGVPLPPDVAVVVSLRTALANRRGRGRFYLPQIAAANVTQDGAILPAAITSLLDGLDGAFGGYTSSGTPVVYSRVGRSTANVVSYDIGGFFDTQRRRENSTAEPRTSRPMP